MTTNPLFLLTSLFFASIPLIGSTPASGPDKIFFFQESDITAIAISPAGGYLLTGHQNGKVLLWDILTQDIKQERHSHTLPVTALAFTADGRYFVSGSDDETLCIWNLDSPFSILDVLTVKAPILDLKFSIDGKTLISSTENGEIQVWDYSDREIVLRHSFSFSDKREKGVRALSFDISHDGETIVLAGDNGEIRIFNIIQKKFIESQRAHQDFINSIRLSSSGSKLVSGSDDGTIKIWNLNLTIPGKATITLEKSIQEKNRAPVRSVTFIDLDKQIVSCANGGICISRSLQGETTSIFPHDNSAYFINKCIYFNAGSYLITVSDDKKARLWFLERNSKIKFQREGDDLAIIFSISNYDHWPFIKSPNNDATALKTILEKKYKFSCKIIEDPSKEEIEATIEELQEKKFKKHDQLLIFFTGHGLFLPYPNQEDTPAESQKGEGFFIPRDAKGSGDDPRCSSCLPFSSLVPKIDHIPCDHIFVMVDACYSGAFLSFKGLLPSLPQRPNNEKNRNLRLIKETMEFRARLAITSGGKTRTSSGINHSPFAQSFLGALNTSSEEKKILTFSNLYAGLEVTLDTRPREGSFGANQPGSNFIFIPNSVLPYE